MESFEGDGSFKARIGYLLWNCWFLIAGYNFLYFVIWFQKNFRHLISKKLSSFDFKKTFVIWFQKNFWWEFLSDIRVLQKKYFKMPENHPPLSRRKNILFLIWEKINWSIVHFFKWLSKPSMNPPPIMRRPLPVLAAGILYNLHKPHFCYRFVTTCNHFVTSCNQGKNLSNLPFSDVLLRQTLYHGKVLERNRRLMIRPEQLLLICLSPMDVHNWGTSTVYDTHGTVVVKMCAVGGQETRQRLWYARDSY